MKYVKYKTLSIFMKAHSPHETPNIEEYGYAISPGTKAFGRIMKRAYELLPKPWGQCSLEHQKLKFFEEYTVDGCLKGEQGQINE